MSKSVVLKQRENGRWSLLIDGVDISQYVTRVEVSITGNSDPEFTIEVARGLIELPEEIQTVLSLVRIY